MYMEIALYTLKLAGLLVANALVANCLGWLLTEWKRPAFDFKPFNCRPCLTFWLTILTGAPLIAIYGEAVAVVLICTALINYIIINSKIQIDE